MAKVGEIVSIRFREKSGFNYTLHVEALEIEKGLKIIGRPRTVFAEGVGEVTGGDILRIKGQWMEFDLKKFTVCQ